MSQRADISPDPCRYMKRRSGGWHVYQKDIGTYLGYVHRGEDGLWRAAKPGRLFLTGWRSRREAAQQLERLLRGAL